MKKHLEKIPYLIFSLFIFITMPFSYYFLNNGSQVLINLILIIFPITTFLLSAIFSYLKEDFSYSFAILIGIFYFLTCIIILNFDVLVYSLLYIFSSLCGQGTGFTIKKIIKIFRKKKQQNK